MSETSAASLTLLSVVRQWPVARNIAEHLPAGSLINLARCSTSLRLMLHGFDMPATLEDEVTTDSGTRPNSDDVMLDVRPRQALQIGAHNTRYWEGLKRAAQFTCSSKTHTKGDKTRSCIYCSMPICESCVVKHSFGKNENTFKNRCRFMCQHCWDIGNIQKEWRWRERPNPAGEYSHKSAAEDRQYCTCTSKDGWVCNDCKEVQNRVAKVSGTTVCFGQDCETVLEEDRDRRKICLWCDQPVPRGRASMESKKAFDQKMIDARERELNSRMADFEEYERNRRRQMRMSRREMCGDGAVRDDPDADVPQFVRNLDTVNYQRVCGEEPSGDDIYRSKHGDWKYRPEFLRCFRDRCSSHKDAALYKEVTSYDSPDGPSTKTNMDLWMMKGRRKLDEQVEMDEFAEGFEAGSDASSGHTPDITEETEEQMPDEEANSHHFEWSEGGEEEKGPNEEFSVIKDDEVAEARKETEAQVHAEVSGSRPEFAEDQPQGRPPEYGADTLVLETGDAMQSN